MDCDPKVSVIIVTYNQENSIARALQSVLDQNTDFPYEIVIGDDCSSDATYDICQEFAAKYPGIIRLFRNKENQGVQTNYFDTLLRCRGKYIADCAGDDFWTDTAKLQKEADVLECNNSISLVHTGWCYYDETSKKTLPSDPHNLKAEYHPVMSQVNDLLLPIIQHKVAPIIHLCTAMYRRDLIMSYYNDDPDLFRNKEYGCEDLQISACMAHAGAIGYIPDVTLCYSIGNASMMSTENPLKTYTFYKKTIKLIDRLSEKFAIDKNLLAQCYTDRINHLYAQAFVLHDRELIAETKSLASEYRVTLSVKSRMKDIITRNEWLWNRFTKSRKP